MNRKRANRKRNPKQEKKPIARPLSTTQSRKLVWKVTQIDDNSQWGWNQITCPDFLRNIWEKMHDLETMTWSEILGPNHHAIPVGNIIREAQKRLQELGYEDVAELVSFRLGSKQRLWAIRSGEEAFLLWWDPEHQICPSHMRYT